MKKIKLAIGVPSTGSVRIEWTESLLKLQRHLLYKAKKKFTVVDIKLFYYCSSVIPKNRQEIIDMALAWNATHILWIDDDMQFPPEAAEALLFGMANSGVKILGANCIKRKYPIEYMAVSLDDKEVDSTGKTGIEEVYYTGNAFVLMDMELFKEIPKPWFAFAWNSAHQDFGTEDIYFMAKAKQHGIGTYIDHDVSQLINHIGVWTFMPQHKK